MVRVLELELSEEAGAQVLCAPEVGYFTGCLPRGSVVAPGESAGFIVALGIGYELRVPAGVHGAVASDPPDRVRQPVGYRDVLYRLSQVDGLARSTSGATLAAVHTESGLVLRAPQSGRFYHRSAPSEPAFVNVGSVVGEGEPIGMIEVMKTFSHVTYRASGAWPKRARVVRIVAKDGADVKSGDALIEFEAAS